MGQTDLLEIKDKTNRYDGKRTYDLSFKVQSFDIYM